MVFILLMIVCITISFFGDQDYWLTDVCAFLSVVLLLFFIFGNIENIINCIEYIIESMKI